VSTDEQHADIEERLRRDMLTTLKRNGLNVADDVWVNILVEELTRDAMHQVELLLTKVEWDE